MMVLAPAIAFIAVDGFARGFGPWEKTVLAALWLVPLVARSVAQLSLIPLGVPAMLAGIRDGIAARRELGLPGLLRRPMAFSGACLYNAARFRRNTWPSGHDIAAFKS